MVRNVDEFRWQLQMRKIDFVILFQINIKYFYNFGPIVIVKWVYVKEGITKSQEN